MNIECPGCTGDPAEHATGTTISPPTSSGQTAEHGIDTAAIRKSWSRPFVADDGAKVDVLTLCDALDRLDAQSKISESLALRVMAASTKLDEIRALLREDGGLSSQILRIIER